MDFEQIFNKEIPDTESRVRQRTFDKLQDTSGFDLEEQKNKGIISCPYVNPLSNSRKDVFNSLCRYHQVTGVKPTRADCYICRQQP